MQPSKLAIKRARKAAFTDEEKALYHSPQERNKMNKKLGKSEIVATATEKEAQGSRLEAGTEGFNRLIPRVKNQRASEKVVIRAN